MSCSTRDTSPRDLCIMTLYRYMEKLDNEGNNEEYFPLKFQNNTYFNFAINIGQKLPLVLTDLLSSCHFFSKDIVIFHSIDDTNQLNHQFSFGWRSLVLKHLVVVCPRMLKTLTYIHQRKGQIRLLGSDPSLRVSKPNKQTQIIHISLNTNFESCASTLN